MILCDSSLAPNPRRVRVFLAEKGVEVPTRQIDIAKAENRKSPYIDKNPLAGLPMLELDDGTCIAESVAICRYFEEKHPDPPLMGVEAVDRAIVEMWNRRMEFEILQTITGVFRHTNEFFKGRVSQIRVGPELKNLSRWYEAVSSRPSARAWDLTKTWLLRRRRCGPTESL